MQNSKFKIGEIEATWVTKTFLNPLRSSLFPLSANKKTHPLSEVRHN